MESSSGSRAAALTASDIRRHVDELFEQGHVLGEDGSRTPLHPHALAQVDARELTALAVSENVGATLECRNRGSAARATDSPIRQGDCCQVSVMSG